MPGRTCRLINAGANLPPDKCRGTCQGTQAHVRAIVCFLKSGSKKPIREQCWILASCILSELRPPIQARYRYSLSLFLIVTKTPLSLSLPLSSPPPTTLRAPGEGGTLCNGRVEHGRSMDPWLGQFGTGATGATTRRHDDTTRRRRCQTPALRACNPRGDGVLRRHRRSAVGTKWAEWGSMPVVFLPWDGRSPASHPTCTQGQPANIGKG